MNKQQLAATIWASANQMRSRIEANEYKDFILGFIFYKYLSDRELSFIKKEHYTEAEIAALSENDTERRRYIQDTLGYFIAYKNLFSTWINDAQKDFSVGDVTKAISAFERNIHPNSKNVFDKIFITLATSMSKLGETTGAQTRAVKKLLYLINRIPMNGQHDYDVLGFIYEYLIGNFAANAGKKAGEFYTPHEVSLLMSKLVAEHLKEREHVSIYDPTSGSGSLLINIGQALGKYIKGEDKIDYFAQELKENTYNLTRMNLVMRNIAPVHINVRNADTLAEDWPIIDASGEHANEPIKVDAVVSNPPYSQNWHNQGQENNARFKNYGLAPEGKADYAFLLHDLYHLNEEGIMAIVLPHGVLFRGNEEGEIRKNLVEKNNIDTIIGLPSNIFFGTSIPTIIMILKHRRPTTDVLIIDASQGFTKEGKNNCLRERDIKKIVDTVQNRQAIPGFSMVATRDQIRQNDYNLNIPRYIAATEKETEWDILATMQGGIPVKEINEREKYWQVFPSLREQIFTEPVAGYSQAKTSDIQKTIQNAAPVADYRQHFDQVFGSLETTLSEHLIDEMVGIDIAAEEEFFQNDIFARAQQIPLVDPYEVYQAFIEVWQVIASDMEIINTETFDVVKVVEPNIELKKDKDSGEMVEEHVGLKGRILPFDLVQEKFLPAELAELTELNNRLQTITTSYSEIIDSIAEEDRGDFLNDDNTEFVAKETKARAKQYLERATSPAIEALKEYAQLSTKKDKLTYMDKCELIDWASFDKAKDGTCKKSDVNNRIKDLQMQLEFEPDTLEYKIVQAVKLMDEENAVKKQLKTKKKELLDKTIELIQNIDEPQAEEILESKWIAPLVQKLVAIADEVTKKMSDDIEGLVAKYDRSMAKIQAEKATASQSLIKMMAELQGSYEDMAGLECVVVNLFCNTCDLIISNSCSSFKRSLITVI